MSTPTTDPTTNDEPTQDRIIADALIEDIVEWRIPPGTWIREREIAERFGVSHAPVREAFRHVARIGFIQVVPWRGAHVIEIERHAAMQVLELWKVNFGVVARFACIAHCDAEAATLQRMIAEFGKLVQRTRNTYTHLSKAVEIGQFISKHSRAQLAADIMARLTLFARWQHRVVRDPNFTQEKVHPAVKTARLYVELGKRIAARDPDGAEAAARKLIDFHQSKFGPILDAYLAERAAAATSRKDRRSKAP
jgi:DNA-binding GntR family transcriptional regulator